MRVPGTLLLLVALASIPRLHAQTTQAPTFRGGVNLIQWDVSVYDADRQPARGLIADDFTLLEDGKPRPILGFVEVRTDPVPPPTAKWMRDAESDVATNDVSDRRIFLLVIDDASFGTGLWWVKTGDRVREIATAFFAELQPTDLVAVVFTGDNRRAEDFTTDHGRLLKAIKSIGAPAMDARLVSVYATDILRRATDYLLAAPGRRKAIVDITTFNMDMSNPDMAQQIMATMKMIETAQRANVSVSMIQPVIDPARVLPSGEEWWNEWWQTGLESGWFLRVARETGGEAIRGVGDEASTKAAVDRVMAANGNYYLLGYVSTDPKKYHNVQVTVNRPGLTVRTRERFYPLKDETPETGPAPPPLLKSIAGILPNSSIRMRANAAPFASSTPGMTTLALTIGVRQILATTGTAPSSDNVQFRIGAFTPEGKDRGAKAEEVRVVLRPNRAGEAEYEVLSTIDLKPGSYALRISAHSRTFETDGSVYLSVEVPDFKKLPIVLSGVLISSPLGPPVSPREGLAGLVPIVPTAQRSFARGQRVEALVRTYRNSDKLATPVPLHIRIVDDHDRVVVEETRPLDVAAFGSARTADVRYDVPTGRLQPGEYLLTFETGADKTATKKDVRFLIR